MTDLTRHARARRPRAALLALALSASLPATPALSAPTPAPMPPPAEGNGRPEREALLTSLEASLAREFAVAPDVALPAAWRARAEALAAEHRARVLAWAAAWFDTLPADAARRADGLIVALQVRYFNALVAWQLDRVDDADDARLLRGLADPGVCATPSARTAFGRWVAMFQRLPEADREPALRAQALLLARWGQPPAADLPKRPAQPWLPSARAALQQLRATPRPVGEPPAPPVLMWSLMPGRGTTVPATTRCVLAAWAMKRAPLRDAPPAEQASTMRQALAWDPLNDTGADDGEKTDDYPVAARRFGVHGKVRVTGRVAAGAVGLEGATVVGRDIRVDGLDGVRPVAFEAALDEASLRRAAVTPVVGRAPGETRTMEFEWRLQ